MVHIITCLIIVVLMGIGIFNLCRFVKLDYKLKRDPNDVKYCDYLLTGYAAFLPTLMGIVGLLLYVIYLIW